LEQSKKEYEKDESFKKKAKKDDNLFFLCNFAARNNEQSIEG